MEPTERFAELVVRPDAEVALDEAALLIAGHDHPVDIPSVMAQLDDLAAGAPTTADGLARQLFDTLAFAGNAAEYGDPANSYLDEVLRRRLGIPITLSVLMMEIGRRTGVELHGVGMPGHFLVGAGGVGGSDARRGEYYDPFHGGTRLDVAGCRDLFAAAHPGVAFLDEYLAPVGAHAILARMLANLVQAFVRRSPASAVWALRLRLLVPGVPSRERRDAAALLGTLGRFEEAAAALDTVADDLDDDAAARAEREAAALRARAN
jgi:regulator of sirC expression with transglutaminase-like and TPR domain